MYGIFGELVVGDCAQSDRDHVQIGTVVDAEEFTE